MSQGAYLYFHFPCFDGITSCVLTWDFLETSQGWKFKKFSSVNYESRANWLSTTLHTPCAVVDFLYHPEAQFWADHHLTTFLNEEIRQDFERRKDKWLIYSSRSGSCAMLLWSRLADSFGYRNPHYKEMVEWADKIDSARYSSVSEAILGDAPALRISSSLALKNEPSYCELLVKALRYQTLDDVARLPEVMEKSERAQSMIKTGLRQFAGACRLEDGGVAVFDVRGTDDAIISRYSPYYFFPEARYSLGVMRFSNGAKITAMRNPWREFPSIFLGKIFEKFGGGGHQRVGSVMLSGERANEAETVLKQLLHQIRKEDSMTGEAT